MNRYFITTLTAILCGFFARSQSFKLYYNLDFIKDTISQNKEERNLVLWVENQNYLFCSNELLNKDSLKNSNLEYSPTILNEETEFMKIKNGNIISSFSLVDDNLYIVNEDFDFLKWEIKNQTKIIGNMECQLAKIQYKGRDWEAWFSTQYPISFGPYIFNGLPGVIVELSDSKKQYIFKLSKIKNTKEDFNRLMNQRTWIDTKPIVVTKSQLTKVYLSHYSDPFRRMKEKKMIYMVDEKTGERQPPPDFNKMTAKAQKYIRDNNNPIEISEAVKY
ncbi:GLPGLI family protein [uncultured Chryseobacterium sp.]|uniref:GLPGLI family protein n=1 Tax=uncultured Chryseobacterium sp. TaxID=259322 RepID=UPI0025E30AEA|nr:GLPGLI family protein [uncultured Chryseobacterium sp.]